MKKQDTKEEVVLMLWSRMGSEEEDKVIDGIKTITKYTKGMIRNTLKIITQKKEDKIRGCLCDYYDNVCDYEKYELDNIKLNVSGLCADIYYDLKENNIRLTKKNVINHFLELLYQE